jgi:hypothetical protein
VESITLAALSAFISACLTKAGEKFSEKTVETAFESRQEIAEKFTGLFKSDIIQLGLSDSSTPEEITKQFAAKPEIIERASAKLQSDADSFKELLAVVREAAKSSPTINNFANQTNNDKSVNIVGDNTKVTF